MVDAVGSFFASCDDETPDRLGVPETVSAGH
jgi:hypothetical protein